MSVTEYFQVADTLIDSFILGFSVLFFLFSAGALLLGLWAFAMSSHPGVDQHSIPTIGISIVGMLISAFLFWIGDAGPKQAPPLTGHALAQLGLYSVIFGLSLGLAGWRFRKNFMGVIRMAETPPLTQCLPLVLGATAVFFSTLAGSSAIVQGLFF